MINMVQECAEGLRDAEEALKTAKESFAIQLEEAAALDAEAAELYNLASAAVQSGDDDTARAGGGGGLICSFGLFSGHAYTMTRVFSHLVSMTIRPHARSRLVFSLDSPTSLAAGVRMVALYPLCLLSAKEASRAAYLRRRKRGTSMCRASLSGVRGLYARRYLTDRKRVQTRFEDAKLAASAAKGRVARVEQSVETLATQARRLEGILKGNMAEAAEVNAAEAAAKFEARGDATASGGAAEFEDPLERKFRELEGR